MISGQWYQKKEYTWKHFLERREGDRREKNKRERRQRERRKWRKRWKEPEDKREPGNPKSRVTDKGYHTLEEVSGTAAASLGNTMVKEN